MTGLRISTSRGLPDVLGPILPSLSGFRWIIDGGAYTPFQWPEDWLLNGLPAEVECRIDHPGGADYVVDTPFLFEFGYLLTNFWIDVYGFATPADPGAWWARAPALPQRPGQRCSTGGRAIDQTDVAIKNRDGAQWDVFAKDERLLDRLRAAWPQATVIRRWGEA